MKKHGLKKIKSALKEQNIDKKAVLKGRLMAEYLLCRTGLEHLSDGTFIPIKYYTASPEHRANICNGCGPGNWKYDLVPDTMYGLYVGKSCCDPHDWMYYYGVTQEEKEFADKLFLYNLEHFIDSQSKFFVLKWLRKKRAYWYYLAVHLCGDEAFKE